MNKTWIQACVLSLTMGLCACATLSPIQPAPSFAPSFQTEPGVAPFVKPPLPAEGSLWTESSSALFSDIKARQPGDTVIVDIVENTSSSLDANTETGRDSSVSAGVSDLFGVMTKLIRNHPDLDPNGKLIGASVANSFKGEGKSDRKGRVTATIAARVVEVLPNQNIVVWGRREMKVNNETQYITVSGIIRPADIDAKNHVASTYLADARIEYSGNGVIADKQRVGWLTRIFDHIWPF